MPQPHVGVGLDEGREGSQVSHTPGCWGMELRPKVWCRLMCVWQGSKMLEVPRYSGSLGEILRALKHELRAQTFGRNRKASQPPSGKYLPTGIGCLGVSSFRLFYTCPASFQGRHPKATPLKTQMQAEAAGAPDPKN